METDPAGEEEEGVFCRVCRHLITRPADRLVIDGDFSRVFANPHGLVFEIGYFRQAPGCLAVSPFSDEFTWFPGYQWRVSCCRSCQTHLGWFFLSDSHGFWGLILEKLVNI